MKRATRTPAVRRILGAATVLALTGALAGCSIIGSLLGGGNVFEIKVGDCFNQPDYEAEEIHNVEIVNCADPHDYEATRSIILTDTAYPSDDDIFDYAEPGCLAAFEEYTGQSYDTFTDYEFSYYWPSFESWADGDREILCFVFHVDDRSAGSVKNFSG